MTEHQMKNKLGAWLRAQAREHPIYFLKVHGNRFQRVGVADYWLVVGGASIHIEMKSPSVKCEPSAIQRKELMAHARAGGVSFVSNDLEACKDVVRWFSGSSAVKNGTMDEHFKGGRLKEVTS